MPTISCRLFLILTSLLLSSTVANGQSCCDNDNTTTLCYLSAADYCFSSDENCYNYSLDGDFMEQGLRQKLTSPSNFGPNGIVPCNIELVELTDPSSVQAINDAGCDIIFMPGVSFDPVTMTTVSTESFIPSEILATIIDWSVECENNLVVASQGEATAWGYTLENVNVNPNTPLGGTSLSAIFDGPFGSLTSFNQGGAFQGVFTGTPSTGFEFLAQDALGKPTIALDLATNDLLAGDIGIFCTGPGDVTNGPGINNNNDKLVCNIFALACVLAQDIETTELLVELCPNETATLHTGQVVSFSDLGTYVDTLASYLGCDSIVTTVVAAKEIANTLLDTKHCNGDGYSTSINGRVYNEANPNGEEMLVTAGGCDSTVLVALQFYPHTAASISPVLCPGEVIPLAIGGQADAPGIYVDTLVNFHGCDSVLTIDLSYYHNDTTVQTIQLCPQDSLKIGEFYYKAGEDVRYLTSNYFGCDSLVITSLILFPAPHVSIDSSVDVTNSTRSPFTNLISIDYAIKWEEGEALSCDDCPNPIVLPNDGITPFKLTLTDDIGCIWDYEILANYICNSFIPNVFSPNNDGTNDLFNRFSSGCPPQEYQLQVFDRWGELIFSTKDNQLSWDGNSKGKPANQGVYVYLLTVKEYGEEKQFTGEFILVR